MMRLPRWAYDRPDSAYPMVKGWLFAVVGLTALVLIFGSIVTVAQSVSARNCAYASGKYHRATHWDFWAGCYIRTGSGQWVQLDKYLQVNR